MKKYGLAVIGGGSAGLVAARSAAALGASVVLINDGQLLGGECLNAGCVPSKALIARARRYQGQGYDQSAARFGEIIGHVHGSIDKIVARDENPEHYRSLGMDVIQGRANFTGPNTVEVQGETISARKFVIATGSSPLIPDVPGLKNVTYLTNESIFKLDRLPKSMIVIGGGPIGAELGQAFAMLGTRVTIIQREDRLLPRDEPGAGEQLQKDLITRGSNIILNAAIDGVADKSGQIEVTGKSGETPYKVEAESLLVATGRRANSDFAPDKAGIKLTDRGAVITEPSLVTTNPNVFAAGDCRGALQFTHTAAEEAIIAVQNAFFGQRLKAGTVPVWATFTTPEIGHWGQTSMDLAKSKTAYVTRLTHFSDLDKAVAEDEEGTILRLLSPAGTLLGVTITGHNASELLSMLVPSGPLPYPTYAQGLQAVLREETFEKFLTTAAGRLARTWVKLRFS